jgi:hypothetical protein
MPIWLSLAAAVGYLGWFVGLCFASLLAWKLLKPLTTRFSRESKDSKDAPEHRKTRHPYIVEFMLALFVCSMLLWDAVKQPEYERYAVTEHYVHILKEQPIGEFPYFSDEKPGPKGDVITPCQEDADHGVNSIGLLRKAVGYTALSVRWIERGTCKAIWPSDFGFTFRDGSTNFKYIGEN